MNNQIPVTAAIRNVRQIPCPRCHQQCGWCGDYRHIHGLLLMAGTMRSRCTMPFDPEGDDCSVCRGAMKVLARTEYTPVTAEGDQ